MNGTLSASDGAERPMLGLISPVDSTVPPEAALMYPNGIRFAAASVGLKAMAPEGYEQVLHRIAPVAQQLREQGADALVLMGTSLSFYRGAAFNRELTTLMGQAGGVPAVTMATAVIAGLRSMGARRLAVATAYEGEVNQRLKSFLQEEDFQVLSLQGLDIRDVEDIRSVTAEQLTSFSLEVVRAAGEADALLVSCGGLRTLQLLEPIERRCGIPVVSSVPHALWAGARLLGLSGRAEGYGRLLSQ